ncbi:MAG: hypothetical protein HY529_04350 [Chloroflexi bacterium]|nr:hypothetical protein [Chloroflexota bacterium]
MRQIDTTSEVVTKKKKRGSGTLLQLLAVIGVLAAIWFSFGQNVLAPRQQTLAPQRLGTMDLVSTIKGSAALSEVKNLHGTDVGLVDAYIAEYAHSSPYHGTGKVTVWIGIARSADAAASLTGIMFEGIQKGGSSFTNLQRQSIAGQEVFSVDGPGGSHFFYNSQKSKERVIWATIDGGDTMSLLDQVLQNF